MDFEFARDEYNGLLKRRELNFVLSFDGATPSRRQILGKLCALQNVPESCVVLDTLKTSFGKQELNGQARIYKDAETMKMTEPSYLIERSNAPESDKGAEEA